jgi:hypothetical protein
MELINYEILFNLILVHENVRPAMLIQPINYSITKLELIIDYITTYFPNLILTKEYQGYQGIIVSKNDYSSQIINNNKMGQILGYPYYYHFDNITENDNYVIELFAVHDTYSLQILANVCNDIIKLPEFKDIAKNAEEALLKHGYNVVINVVVSKIPSYDSVITELLSERELSPDHIEFINNQIWNYLTDGTNDQVPQICTHLDYSNKIHRGIIIALLLDFKHDRLNILYPLKGNIKVHVNKVTQRLSDNINQVLSGSKYFPNSPQ